jgi:hypothetical protein
MIYQQNNNNTLRNIRVDELQDLTNRNNNNNNNNSSEYNNNNNNNRNYDNNQNEFHNQQETNTNTHQHYSSITSLHSKASSHNSRFAFLCSSPPMNNHSNTISISTLNVRGISVRSKFDALCDDILINKLSIVALQETRLTELSATTMFKDFNANKTCDYIYRSYWSFDPNDRCGGVGFIISSYISKYVQKIHRFHSR